MHTDRRCRLRGRLLMELGGLVGLADAVDVRTVFPAGLRELQKCGGIIAVEARGEIGIVLTEVQHPPVLAVSLGGPGREEFEPVLGVDLEGPGKVVGPGVGPVGLSRLHPRPE